MSVFRECNIIALENQWLVRMIHVLFLEQKAYFQGQTVLLVSGMVVYIQH